MVGLGDVVAASALKLGKAPTKFDEAAEMIEANDRRDVTLARLLEIGKEAITV